MRRGRWRVATVSLLTAACASTPSNSTPTSVSTPRVDFTAAPADAATAPAGTTAPPTVRAAQGQIEILGQLVTPAPCFDLSASLTAGAPTLRVVITATRLPGMCAAVLETFAYRAVIAGVPPGDYSLEVVHSVGNTQMTAMTRRVTVR